MDQPILESKSATYFYKIPLEPLELQTVAEFAAGRLRCADPAQVVTGISTDTRTIGEGDLFLALHGEKFDGHQFLDAAVHRGALGAITSAATLGVSFPPQFALIEVENTLSAYQQIATRYRRTMPMKMVAITGSNGKTSTKDLTAAVLGNRYQVLRTQGNFNNHLGVPMTLLRAARSDEYAVLEMGMNHPGEIAPLAAMADPDIAVVTNIGTAHLEFMGSRAAIAQEKGSLVEAVHPAGCVVLAAEDEFTTGISRRSTARIVTVGFSKGDVRAQNIRYDESGTTYTLICDHGHIETRLPIPGRHMVLNSLLAAAVGQACGLPLEQCAAALATANLSHGRLERKTVCKLQILDDSYNANPDSMTAALETLANLPVSGRRIAVLGRMGELGAESERGHRQVGDAAAHVKIHQLLTVGAEAEYIAENARAAGLTDVLAVSGVEEAARWISKSANSDDLILIKGSRSAGMERILQLLNSAASSANTL